MAYWVSLSSTPLVKVHHEHTFFSLRVLVLVAWSCRKFLNSCLKCGLASESKSALLLLCTFWYVVTVETAYKFRRGYEWIWTNSGAVLIDSGAVLIAELSFKRSIF